MISTGIIVTKSVSIWRIICNLTMIKTNINLLWFNLLNKMMKITLLSVMFFKNSQKLITNGRSLLLMIGILKFVDMMNLILWKVIVIGGKCHKNKSWITDYYFLYFYKYLLDLLKKKKLKKYHSLHSKISPLIHWAELLMKLTHVMIHLAS